MPAPRNCRSCGAALPGDLRWCGQCYAPVTEFAPRARLHNGDFADRPIDQRGNVPHWSRTEKTATSFGLAGRMALTALFFGGVLLAASTGYFIYVLAAPVVGFFFLSAVWSKAWVVPGERDLPPLPDPERPDQVPSEPLTAAMWTWRVVWVSVAAAALLVVAYGSEEARFAVFSVVALVGMWWFIRGFLAR